MPITTPTHDLRYPVGPAPHVLELRGDARTRAIDTLNRCPVLVRAAVAGLTGEQLDTRYRDGGWTVRQVVHHVADSHLNAYVRYKLAMTEDRPSVRPYEEQAWAELPEAAHGEVELSLRVLDALHARWAAALSGLMPAQAARSYEHPASGGWTVDGLLAYYAWHTTHHVAHVTRLAERLGW